MRLIHAAKITGHTLLLYENEGRFTWHTQDGTPTEVSSDTLLGALRNARRHWRLHAYRTLNCGYRFQLTPRDEHGRKALLCELAASYSSPSGNASDEEGAFRVDNPSREALELCKVNQLLA